MRRLSRTKEGSPFGVRGVVEGFYGTYYTFPERNELIRFLGRNGFNFYLYGPKNDRQHRARWWEPYPPTILDEFASSIQIAHESGVTFCYAISFGVPLTYLSSESFAVITAKLRAFFDRGCRSFGVFLDDLDTPEGSAKSPVAGADADCCNRLYAWATALDASCSLYVCPTEYHGRAPFGKYLHDLGKTLHPDINLLYTGPEVCSSQITVADAAGFAEAAGRQPVIWDNYPVNDGTMRSEMHIGPLRGRDPLLHEACKGFVSNPMNQPEASKVALLTVAEYLSDPCHYDPEGAWRRALLQVGGEESAEPLLRFAENSLASCLECEEAPKLTRLTAKAVAAIERGGCITQVDHTERHPTRPHPASAGGTVGDTRKRVPGETPVRRPAASAGRVPHPEGTRCAVPGYPAAGLGVAENTRGSEAIEALSNYLDVLDESTYHLKNRMCNLALRHELLPWIEALDEKIWLGRSALACFQALESGAECEQATPRGYPAVEERLAEVRRNPKRIGGSALESLASHALERPRYKDQDHA